MTVALASSGVRLMPEHAEDDGDGDGGHEGAGRGWPPGPRRWSPGPRPGASPMRPAARLADPAEHPSDGLGPEVGDQPAAATTTRTTSSGRSDEVDHGVGRADRRPRPSPGGRRASCPRGRRRVGQGSEAPSIDRAPEPVGERAGGAMPVILSCGAGPVIATAPRSRPATGARCRHRPRRHHPVGGRHRRRDGLHGHPRDRCLANGLSPHYFLKRQALFVLLGVVGMVVLALIDYRRLELGGDAHLRPGRAVPAGGAVRRGPHALGSQRWFITRARSRSSRRSSPSSG